MSSIPPGLSIPQTAETKGLWSSSISFSHPREPGIKLLPLFPEEKKGFFS
jgi:hypothetical protein